MLLVASISRRASMRQILIRRQRVSAAIHGARFFASHDKNDAVAVPSDTMVPIDFDVSSKIEGEESQIVTVTLKNGQKLRAESGAMLYMTRHVQMETTAGSGLSDGFKRMLTGQNLFTSDFTYTGESDSGQVALGTDFPSKILKLNLQEYGGKLVCQRGAYLASNADSVDIEMEFTKKFSTGFFGGQGFVLQALVGTGDVFVKAGGTCVKRVLNKGETLRVSSGSLVAFEPSVEYDIQTMPGFKNVMFGGEGLFVTTLTGPGTVWLQGLPPDRMISEIARRVPAGGLGFGIPIGMGGGGGEDASGEDAGGAEDMGGGEEDMVAATDAAIDADRQATVASSGMMAGEATQEVDSESPSALFGDAAGSNESVTATAGDDFATGEDNDFSQGGGFSEPTFQDESFPEMDDTSSFSTEETDFPQDEFKDETTFSTFDDDPSSSDVFDAGGGADDEEGGVAGSVLRTLWDFFTGGDD